MTGSPVGAPTSDPLDRIDLGEYTFLIRERPGERFVATNEVVAQRARIAGWGVFDLRALVAVARAAREYVRAEDADTDAIANLVPLTEQEGTRKDADAKYEALCSALSRLDGAR